MNQSLVDASTGLDPTDLPAGVTLQDPHGGNHNLSSNGNSAPNSNATATQQQQQQQQQQKQSILEQVMEPDALARLRRIQMVKPQRAKMLENAMIQLASSNQLTEPISDGKFVEMLERQVAQENRNNAKRNDANNVTNDTSSSLEHINSSSGISIQRKKYAMDSDDDDDNDDDLL
jgi:programmed cell death protein 5